MSTPPVEPEHHEAPALHRAPVPLRHKLGLAGAAALLVGSGILGGVALAPGSTSSTAGGSTGATSTLADGQPPGGQAVSPQLGLGGGSSTSGAAYTPESYGDATRSQSVGLVEISSTLTNGTAAGTGMILTSDGTVVTNHHVVAGATSVKVTDVSTGTTYAATYVGGDATADIAVLELVDASGLTPITLTDTAAAVGDEVTAVGDAGGDGGALTASPGTISAVDQSITVTNDDGSTSNLTGLIEIDAYVVPGDSGGVVRNADGDAVGMNVAASSGSRDVVGYAIPISTVTDIASRILAGDSSATISLGYSGFIGVGLSPSSTAPLVVGVQDGGAADQAGIVAGDTITRLNGSRITGSDQLRSMLADLKPGERVTLGWTDAGGTSHAGATVLGQAPIS